MAHETSTTCVDTRQMSVLATEDICLVSAADIGRVTTADICPVSTADIYLVSTEETGSSSLGTRGILAWNSRNSAS